MEKLVKPWRWICWTIQNTLNKMLPWLSRLQFGGGWRQLRSINHQHMMSLLAIGNPPKMTLWPTGFLVLVLPWMCYTEILFAVKMIMTPWITSSHITYITLILWVLAKKKQDLMKCSVVLSRLLSIHSLPHLLRCWWIAHIFLLELILLVW